MASTLTVEGQRKRRLSQVVDASEAAKKEAKRSRVKPSKSPLGLFSMLPCEMQYMVLEEMDMKSLVAVSLSSRQLMLLVENYSVSTIGWKAILGGLSSPEDFKQLGILQRLTSTFYSSKKKLKTAKLVLEKLDNTHRTMCEINGCPYSYKCFGELFSVFVNGWAECDKKRAFSLVYNIANVKERLDRVLSSPATFLSHESDVRALLRSLFLEKSCCENDYGFWLTMILKPLPLTYQSQVLYILTAPTDSNGFVSWTQECGCSTLQHESCTVNFTELSRALMILYSNRSEWSEDDIISIIDEMTSYPNEWCLENVARLLKGCGPEICKEMFGNRVINGRLSEACIMAYYLAQVCVCPQDETGTHTTCWFIDVLQHVISLLPAKDKSKFAAMFMNTWSDYLSALFEDNAEDLDEEDRADYRHEFNSGITSLTKLSAVLMCMALET